MGLRALAFAWLVVLGCAPRVVGPAGPVPAPPSRPSGPGPSPEALLLSGGIPVTEVREPPVVDGRLADWDAEPALPVEQRPPGEEGAIPPRDLEVRAGFAFDATSLYVAVVAADDSIETRQRAWRYGDGFLVTIGSAAEGSATRRFASFGVPYAPSGQVEVVVVNRDGEYFPREEWEGLRAAAVADDSSGTITYEVAIPWRALRPFLPLVHQAWGVNVTYVDGDSSSGPEPTLRQRRVQLVADGDFDTEGTTWRRVQAVRVAPADSPGTRCQLGLATSSALPGDGVGVALGCLSTWAEPRRLVVSFGPEEAAAVELEASPSVERWRVLRTALEVPRVASGSYPVTVSLWQGDERVWSGQEELFVVGEDALAIDGALRDLETGGAEEPLAPSAQIRLSWIQEVLRRSSPVAPAEPLARWVREAGELLEQIRSEAPVWPPPGVIRLAHRSEIDGTLQPYSVFVPQGYDPMRPPPLLVALHGSGVDEAQTIQSAAESYRDQGWLVLAPQARGLSDFYLGSSGEDVIECMDHLRGLLPYDTSRVYLSGFSMGGYGAWRLALLYPRRFRRVAVLSGCTAPRAGQGNAVEDLLARADRRELRRQSLLVVHGALDRAVPIEPVRRLVSRLEALGVRHELVELPEAAHGGYDVTDRVIAWFEGEVAGHGGGR